MATKRPRRTDAKRKRGTTLRDLSLQRRRGDTTGAVKGGAQKRGGARRADCEPMT